MNRLDPEDLKPKPPVPSTTYDSKVEARRAAYLVEVDGKEQLYIPSRCIYSNIIKASKPYHTKGRRTSLSSLLAGTIRIEPEEILLGHCNYEIDERVVTIGNAKVLAWRPKISEWEAVFAIVYYKKYVTSEVARVLQEILEDGGIRFGIGDFRPEHKGPFGTFTVEQFEIE